MRNANIQPSLLEGSTVVSLLGVKSCKPLKCYLDSERDVVDWIPEPLSRPDRVRFEEMDERSGKHALPRHKSLDCSIKDVADDIAYGVHDLEDVIALDLVSRDEFSAALLDRCPTFLNALKTKNKCESANDGFSVMGDELFGGYGNRKHCINRLEYHFVTAVEFVEMPDFQEPLVR